MDRNIECVKELKRTMSTILGTKEKREPEKYIEQLKSLLFFVGKEVLLSFYRKSKVAGKGVKRDSTRVEYSEWIPDIVIDLEPVYGNTPYLKIEDKEKILNIIGAMDVKEIKSFSLGELYEGLITSRERKYLGQVYTPKEIVIQMVTMNIKEEEIIKNPYLKIIDPACGGGYFLIECYHIIKDIFEKNMKQIALINQEAYCQLEDNIHGFIIRNNLWGTDIDDFAVFMTSMSLIFKDIESYTNPMIFIEDVLLYGLNDEHNGHFMGGRFNLVIGNPPYIGHKKIDKQYRNKLQKRYNDVYSDKSDISYCFFKLGYELLDCGGKLAYITSRYFSEALSANGLRRFIKSQFSIDTIVDFYGENPFKGIGISPIIVSCTKNELVKNKVHIYKMRDNVSERGSAINTMMNRKFEDFYVNQEDLEDAGWIMVNQKEKRIYDKIHSQGNHTLSQLCQCNQGIITGNDQAFIVDYQTTIYEELEADILKPWIKNSDIHKYKITDSTLYIIYTDSINDTSKYKNTMDHIRPYRDKLSKRRECLKGTRKWHQLQWGRDLKYFLNPKIIFPYKAQGNRFALDHDGALSSADVYIINITDSSISLEFLLGFLNSSLFEFYFKTVAKKLGKNIYEYYPNKIMNLRLKSTQDKEYIEEKVLEIIKLYKVINTRDYDKIMMDINGHINSIDEFFYKLYNIEESEIEIIENRIKS